MHTISEKMPDLLLQPSSLQRVDGETMRLHKRRLLLVCLTALLYVSPLLAATHKASPQTTPKKSVQKPQQRKSPSKAPAKSSGARSTKPLAKSTAAAKEQRSCRMERVKTSKGYVKRRVCSGQRAEQSLRSPITENALSKSSSTDADVKARVAPDRAYAVDGQTFFYQGRKYRVAGIKSADNSDMAKQRLQRSLESGSLMVDPLKTDESGVATATVRINGHDIAEQLP